MGGPNKVDNPKVKGGALSSAEADAGSSAPVEAGAPSSAEAGSSTPQITRSPNGLYHLYPLDGNQVCLDEDFYGEVVGVCPGGTNAEEIDDFYLNNADEFKCIRDALAKKGVSLPQQYFYLDGMSNIRGHVCLNVKNVAKNQNIIENHLDLIKACLGGDEDRVDAFERFIDLQTPHKEPTWYDKILDGTFIGFGFAFSALILNYAVQKASGKSILDRIRNGKKDPPDDRPPPPPAPPVKAPEPAPEPAPETGGEPVKFSVPEMPELRAPTPAEQAAVRNVSIGAAILGTMAIIGEMILNVGGACMGLFIIAPGGMNNFGPGGTPNMA